jgi:ribosome maturation factor RimP
MNSIDKNILDLAQKKAEEHNLLLIDFIVRGTNRNRIIEIYYDSENNISAEDLAEVSREINTAIEEASLLEGNYRLDVSSPGTDRPLIFLQQYPKHINRKFELSYKDNEETKKYSGKLIRVDGEVLTFLSGQNETSINFNNIKKAKVIVSFT